MRLPRRHPAANIPRNSLRHTAPLKESHGKIRIKKRHKGLLHKELGAASGKPIPASKLAQAARSKDPAERKRAVFAENAKKFKH